jgi:hypothetical protein
VSNGSPYRNEIDALRERKASLEAELTKLRAETAQLEGLKAQEGQLARELAEVEARIAPKRGLPMLDRISVASPCSESWGEMVGDERVRYCLKCEKNVFNLSAMNRDEAEALLQQRAGGEVCVRYYQRADGTIMTQDCPVGVSKKRRKKVALAVAGAGAMAFAAASLMNRPTCTLTRMGAVAGEAKMGEAMPAGEYVMGDRMETSPPPPVTPTPSAAPTTDTPHRPHVQGGVRPPSIVGRIPVRH